MNKFVNIFDFDKFFFSLDPGFGTKNQNISTWIDSSHAQLNINKEDDYIGFDESAIALPILLNSPPNSIKSNSSHDETDSCNAFFANEPEESFNFVDPFQPIKNSQDDLYGGPVAFHTEIETVSRNQIFNITTTNNNRSDNEKDIFMGMETPIIGNDLMIGREICGFNFKQIKSETPDMKVNINETMNGNTVPMQSVQKKLLARRTMNRPQIQLNIKIEPVLSIDNEPMLQEKVTNSNVITTPQITKEILELENDFDLVDYIVEDDVSIYYFKAFRYRQGNSTVEIILVSVERNVIFKFHNIINVLHAQLHMHALISETLINVHISVCSAHSTLELRIDNT